MATSSPSIYRDLHDLYHSNKVAKAGPGLDDRPEHPSVQINSSSPWTHQKTCTIIDFYSFYLGFLALYCFDIEWQIESKSLKCVHNSRPTTHPKGVVISEVIFNLVPSSKKMNQITSTFYIMLILGTVIYKCIQQ